jgi:hypothetical protein
MNDVEAPEHHQLDQYDLNLILKKDSLFSRLKSLLKKEDESLFENLEKPKRRRKMNIPDSIRPKSYKYIDILEEKNKKIKLVPAQVQPLPQEAIPAQVQPLPQEAIPAQEKRKLTKIEEEELDILKILQSL